MWALPHCLPCVLQCCTLAIRILEEMGVLKVRGLLAASTVPEVQLHTCAQLHSHTQKVHVNTPAWMSKDHLYTPTIAQYIPNPHPQHGTCTLHVGTPFTP